jgi:hypothetical protein
MNRGIWRVLLVLAIATGLGACRKFPTVSVNRRPVISSVIAFPTTLGLGDSTLITVFATDPDGDSLVYDWNAYNGLVTLRGSDSTSMLYHTPSPSRVFYLIRRSASYDTAFVSCEVRDVKGGSDGQTVIFTLR